MLRDFKAVLLSCVCVLNLINLNVHPSVAFPCLMWVIDEDLSYADAETRCQENNFTGLAVLNSKDAVSGFINAINEAPCSVDPAYWVGLTLQDETGGSRFRWADGHYANQTSGDHNADLRCGKADRQGHVHAAKCDELRKGVCAVTVLNPTSTDVFRVLEGAWSYEEARQECLDQGYQRLAVLDTEEKLDLVIDMCISQETWIGLRTGEDDEVLRWASGQTITWAKWFPSTEPDRLNDQKCVRITDYGFATKYCHSGFGAVCEKKSVPTCPDATKLVRRRTVWTSSSPMTSPERISTPRARSSLECHIACIETPGCKYSAYRAQSHACASLSSRYNYPTSTSVNDEAHWKIITRCG